MKNKNFNLQFFAEEQQPLIPPTLGDPTPPADPNPPKVEFTPAQQEYINKLINIAVGKTKSQIDSERAKHEEERKRSEELAKITDEKDRKLKEYELQMADIEKERASMERERMTNKTMSFLSEKKLPVNMAKYLVSDTEVNTKAAIGEFEKSFLSAVSDEVNVRLKGAAPIIQANPGAKVDVSKMSTEEFLEYRKKNKL